jgi:hypothetical protein
MRLFGPSWIEEKRSILIVGPDFKRLQCRINYPDGYYALNVGTSEELEVWVVGIPHCTRNSARDADELRRIATDMGRQAKAFGKLDRCNGEP